LGWSFFALSSSYRETQSWEYYVCSKHIGVSYTDFLQMPVYLRRFLIDKLVKENSPEN